MLLTISQSATDLRALFCAIIFSIFFVSGVQANNSVQLLLVRDGTPSLTCDGKEHRSGKLYGVPDELDLSALSSVDGLTFLASTQELPYFYNESNISSIPEGTYSAFIRNDETKPWMKENINRSWRLQLKGTAHRTAIQFHYGQDHSWSAGCIILTDGHQPFCKNNVDNSAEHAVEKLRNYVMSEAVNSHASIKVRIADQL